MDQLAQCLDFAEDTRRRVDMSDGNDLVGLLLERLLNLVELWAVANRGLELGGLDAIRLEAVGEGVGKVARVQDKDVVAGLDQVGSDLVPSEGAGAGDDKGLGGGIGSLKQAAQVLEDLAEGGDEGRTDMRFAANACQRCMGGECRGEATCGGSWS